MIVNPETFQAIKLDKQNMTIQMRLIKSDNKTVETLSSVRLLGVQLDDELNFSLHVSNICKSAANQLSALIRLNNFLHFERKRILINSYFMSNFHLLSKDLQKRALRFLYNDYQLSYKELLEKVKQLHNEC